MPEESTCGARTKAGNECRFSESKCPHHQGWRKRPTLEAEIVDRDLHILAWWMIQEGGTEKLEPKFASVINQIARMFILLGQEGEDKAEMVARIVVRGRLMQGLPRATREQWALAEVMFEDEALEKIRR